jgi:transcriptional regulator
MYQPLQFRSQDPAHARALMRAHPLASLVSTDDTGFPVVTHLPLHLEEQDGELALATFLGPQAYLSPGVYPDLARVPSWNYLAVHCRVEATLIDDPEGKDALLKALIGQHEPPYAEQWRALPEDYTGKMLKAIVGFELRVTELQCTLKLNQHRPESHAALHARYREGDADAQALAGWMETLGLVPAGEH